MASDAKKIIDFGNYVGGEEALQVAARALRSLNKDVTNLSKTVADDSGRIAAGFATIKAGIADVQSKAGKLQLFSGEDKAILAALASQLGELKKRQEEYKATQVAQATIQRGLSDVTKQYTSELAKQKDALRAATLANDAEAQRKAAAAIRATTQETTQLSKALRGANSEFTAAKGSYDALVIENNKLLASLHGLEGGLQAGSQEAAKLKKQIYDNTETLKLFDQETNRSFRNVGNYAQSFSGLIAELAKARASQAGLTAGSEEYNRAQIRITGFQTAAQKSAAQMGLSYEQAEAKIEGVTGAIQPLTTALVRLEKEQAKVAESTGKESEAYRKIGFQIESTKKQIEEVAASTAKAEVANTGLEEQLGFTGQAFKEYLTQLAVGAIGLQAIVGGIQAVFEANVQYSRDLAEVRKTTGLTADEADRLGQSLKQLDTPTSLQGLLKIAGVGGQLGIAKNDLLEFTKAIDIAVQALGNDFTGGAEEIATTLGKISSVFGKELGNDAAKNILAIGSAVNQLGAEGAATAPFLTDVALRVGAVASQSGLGLKDVLAYAAVLQETGFSAETSGTALNRFFSVLSTRTKEAFEIAKNANPALTLKDFTKLVNTDFNGAIQAFLKGLRAGGQTTTALSKELATLKLQSGEAKNAIITLSQNADLYAQRQQVANDQLRDASSLAQEAAVNTATLGGEVDKLTNETKNFFTSGAAGDFLKWLVSITRLLYANTIGNVVQSLGDGISYLSQKAGLSKAPLDDFAAGIGAAASAAYKQAAAQQALLDSYKKLDGLATRTGAQEKELSDLRAKLGSSDVAALQKNIDAIQQRGDGIKEQLKRDLTGLTADIEQTTLKLALNQEALGLQARRLTAEQLAQVKQIAQARLDANSPLTGKSSNPALEGAITQATRLLKAERELAEQQRNRANILAALSKLQGNDTQGKKDAAEAADEEEKAEAQLDRTAQQRAKNRAQALRDALADNQKNIDQAKAYQAEQGKLFEDKQITGELFAQSVAGSQDLITQYERDGAAIRIKIAKAEAAEKLAEADNDRIRQSKKKDISEAELADIQGQYAARRVEIARKENRDIKQAQEDLQKQLEVKPLEFRVVGKVKFIDPLTGKEVDNPLDSLEKEREASYQRSLVAIEGNAKGEMTAVANAFAEGKTTRQKYEDELFAIRQRATKQTQALLKKFHKESGEADKDAADAEVENRLRTEERIKRIADKAGNTLLAIDGYYTQFRQNELDTRTQAVEEQYKNEVAAAGENKEELAKIEKRHDKEVKKLAYDQAKIQRDQAAFTVAIQTAVAITKAFAESPATFGLPFSAVALANGLVQEALIFSKPLPAYFKGRQGGKAEMAEVSERGPELIKRAKTGKMEYVPQRAIVPLAAGDDVYTAQRTSEMLAAAGLNHQQAQQPAQLAAAFGGAAQSARESREAAQGQGLGQLAANIDANTEALRKLKPTTVHVHRGSDASVQTSQSLTHYMSQLQFKKPS